MVLAGKTAPVKAAHMRLCHSRINSTDRQVGGARPVPKPVMQRRNLSAPDRTERHPAQRRQDMMLSWSAGSSCLQSTSTSLPLSADS